MSYHLGDLNMIAYLALRGIKHSSVRLAEDGRRVLFEYSDEDKPAIRDAQRLYLSGEANVDPMSFARTLRSIRVLTSDTKVKHEHFAHAAVACQSSSHTRKS